MTIWKSIQREFTQGNALNRLILINIAVFAIIKIFGLLSWLITQSATSVFTVAVITNVQTYLNPEVLIRKPWTLFTYMFVHEGFLHLLFNMLWLFWFGRIFIDLLKGKRLFAVFTLGGIFGALFAVAGFAVIPALHHNMVGGVPMIGASAAVIAIVIATATYFPNYQVYLLFFGQVRLKYLAIVMVALDLISLPGLNSRGVLSHLGGALFGFVWAWQLKQGNDIAAWFVRLCDWIVQLFEPKPKMRVTYRNQKSNISDVKYEDVGHKVAASQAEIDAILDKISKNGYDSLTKKEKDLLFRQKF
ncbi:MAG: rhomboid family intramembrane serine protease [Bacteroidales bacterium]|jgi:membrane associated rhomboid family serine protease|nr:rhomboid family intramembrane serine protease [Bacteroidales bacterium]